MSSNSINTNAGAMVALRNLETANRAVDRARDRVATGLKVQGAVDDASSFSIAQGVRGDLKAYAAVSQGLANARGLSEVALNGATSFSDLMGDLRKKIIEGMNPANTAAQQALIDADHTSILGTMRTILENSSYNGTNQLIEIAVPFNTVVGQVRDVNVISNIDGSTLLLRGQRLDLSWALLNQENLSTTAAATAALAVWDTAMATTNTALGELGADRRRLEAQDRFISVLSDQVETGLGAAVDADIAKEQARALAAEVRQQLSVQTLSIANQRPTVLLDLFQS